MICTFNMLGRYGRLCNQMYQIAGVIGVARKNGCDFGFPYWKNYDHLERFGSSEDIDIQKHFVNSLPLYDGPTLPDHPVQWGYWDVKLDRSVSLSGHFQSVKYFDHALDEIKWYFTMKDEYPASDYCAVHWRAGDYSTEVGYHPRMTMDYYRPAMAEFPNDQPYLVFSDDISAARQMFGDKVDYANGDYLDDFKRMKACRHFIISNSSFSAMAAVLSESKDKRVIAPRPWFGPAAQITGEDIYDEGWKVINWA